MPLPTAKRDYLARYNHELTEERAVSRAISAACQHNSLYEPLIGTRVRQEVRTYWAELLHHMAQTYTVQQTCDRYLRDVHEMVVRMNETFAQAFRTQPHPRYGYDPGFRVSHSQKSLSVYLKHLWCLGVVASPPQCPVDAQILKKAGIRYPEARWACVNSIPEHQAKVAVLSRKAEASGLTLAEWELLQF